MTRKMLGASLMLAGILVFLYSAARLATAEVAPSVQTLRNQQEWETFSKQWRVIPTRPEPPAIRVPSPHPVPRYNTSTPIRRRTHLWGSPRLHGEVGEQAEIVNLLRICTCESEGSAKDCLGIWQVIKNIRSRTCNREHIPQISECDEHGETLLSAMQRAQRFATGAAPTTQVRARWVSKMTSSCDMPEGFPNSTKVWERQHRGRCEALRSLATRLVRGARLRLTSAPIIAWGGRCEDRRGACDDHRACARGLMREDTPTANAFWRRAGQNEEEPICAKYRTGG